MIDLETKNLKWTREINYNTSEVQQQGPYYFLREKKKNSFLDPETGNLSWENRCEFYFTDPYLNIGVGYPAQSMSNKLSAIDLSNGKTLWSKNVNRDFGWNDAYMWNDSILLIAANGIQALNLINGSGWTYKANTTKKEVGKMIGVNAFGLILGMLTGVYTYQTEPDVASDMMSNMLIDPDGNVLFASRDRISRVDHAGNIGWSQSLPEKITSKSSLLLVDSVIYMINRGHALYNGGFSPIGDPYIAAFDLYTGKQLYFTHMAEEKGTVINYQIINDQLFLVFEDKIATYSLRDGIAIKEKAIDLQKEERLEGFAEPGLYVKQDDSIFTELTSGFYNYNVITTTGGRAFVLTDSLETLVAYDGEDLFHRTIDNPHYTLVTRDDSDFIVLDHSNNALATFKAVPNMFLHQDTLYFFDKDAFWEIDLPQLQYTPSVWQSIFRNVSKYLPAV